MFKIIQQFKKITNFFLRPQGEKGVQLISKQKRFDQQLVYSLSKTRIPSLKQIKKLPELLSRKEKIIIESSFFFIILSLFFLGTRLYLKHVIYVPKMGGEYTEGLLGAPRFINPVLAPANDTDMDIAQLVFSGLFKHNKNQEIIADLAERYEISQDQKTYNIFLKKNINWQDGVPLQSDDIVFTFKNIKNPVIKSPLRPNFQGVTVEKINDHALKFVLTEPYAPFLENLTFGILPEHIWQNVDPVNFYLAEYNLKPIGSGMYKWSELKKDKDGNIKTYSLEHNTSYYGRQPNITKLNFKFYPDYGSLIEGLRSKEIMGISFLPNDLRDNAEKIPYLNYYYLNLSQYSAIFFNRSKNEILQDQNFKKALAMSINKERLIAEALKGNGKPIDSPFIPGLVGYNPDAPKYEFNINKANELLEKSFPRVSTEEVIAQQQKILEKQIATAREQMDKKTPDDQEKLNQEISLFTQQIEDLKKLKELPFFRKKGDKIITLQLTTVNKPENIAGAYAIKLFWQSIGLEIKINILEENEMQDAIQTRNYEALLYSEIIGNDPDPYPFWHSSQAVYPGLNISMFANKDADKLLEDARQTPDIKIRQEKYTAFQNILTNELPAIFLYNPIYTYVLNSGVKGVDIKRISIPSDRFANIEEWYVKTGLGWK